VSRQDELQALLDRLLASARARTIRAAWDHAAERLGLELRAAPRLFDDVVEGAVDGHPVRVAHLTMPELPALSAVVSIDALGGFPPELVLEASDLLGAYDWARATEAARSSITAYRGGGARPLEPEVRAMLHGASASYGACLRQGGLRYHHQGPLDDGAAIVALVHALAEVTRALLACPDAIPDQLLAEAQGGASELFRARAAEMLARCYPACPHRSSLPPRPGSRAPGTE
jgi:hypothetical protein